MSQLNLKNIRFVGKSFSFISGCFLGVIPNKTEVKEGFPSLFGISEDRYKWKDLCYKIGLKSKNPVVHSNDYYTSDLRSIIKKINREGFSFSYGFYEIKELSDKSFENLAGKTLLMNIAMQEDSSFIETVVVVDKQKKLILKDKIRITNMTTPKENIEFVSLSDFDLLVNNDIVNIREMVLLKGQDGTAEGWLRDQEDESIEEKYSEKA